MLGIRVSVGETGLALIGDALGLSSVCEGQCKGYG